MSEYFFQIYLPVKKETSLIGSRGRAGSRKKSFFYSFLEFESQNSGKLRRARDGASGGLRGVVRGEYNVLRAGADPGEIMLLEPDDVGEQREPGAE